MSGFSVTISGNGDTSVTFEKAKDFVAGLKQAGVEITYSAFNDDDGFGHSPIDEPVNEAPTTEAVEP